MGANDFIFANASTFKVEMDDCNKILTKVRSFSFPSSSAYSYDRRRPSRWSFSTNSGVELRPTTAWRLRSRFCTGWRLTSAALGSLLCVLLSHLRARRLTRAWPQTHFTSLTEDFAVSFSPSVLYQLLTSDLRSTTLSELVNLCFSRATLTTHRQNSTLQHADPGRRQHARCRLPLQAVRVFAAS